MGSDGGARAEQNKISDELVRLLLQLAVGVRRDEVVYGARGRRGGGGSFLGIRRPVRPGYIIHYFRAHRDEE